MGAERRLENKRMKVTKRMEVSCLESGRYCTGETEDVSDSGIRACLDRSPSPGASVMVRLFWEENRQPVETFGRVAWSTPLPAGEGIEVGLMLGADTNIRGTVPKTRRQPTRYHKVLTQNTSEPDVKRTYRHSGPVQTTSDDDSIENKQTLAAISSPMHSRVVPVSSTIELQRGESFEVTLQGTRTWAKILDTGNIDADGRIHVSLEIKNKHLWANAGRDTTNSVNSADATARQSVHALTRDASLKPGAPRQSNTTQRRYKSAVETLPLFSNLKKIGSLSTAFFQTLQYFIWRGIPLNARSAMINTADSVSKLKRKNSALNVKHRTNKRSVRQK